ncbi:MAG: HHL1-like protein [Oculatellaceae cyanobacterium bins.114]|nr:HHL1-like protein [Oculatellaceae cyanobacterium bins.114]
MSANLGFGKPQSQPKAPKRSPERAKAAQQYDRLKTDGTPDYEIYIRIQGRPNWFPVGAIAIKRSSQINQAIFDSQQELLQGAFRLFPMLRKHQQHLEYGYRLKEFKDEPIQLAVPPKSSRNPLQNAVGQLGDRLTSIFKRG